MERYMDVSTNATSMDKGLIEYDDIVLTIFFVQVRSEKLTCMFLNLIMMEIPKSPDLNGISIFFNVKCL